MLQPSTCAESQVNGDRCGQGVLCLKLLAVQCDAVIGCSGALGLSRDEGQPEDMFCSHQSGEKKRRRTPVQS